LKLRGIIEYNWDRIKSLVKAFDVVVFLSVIHLVFTSLSFRLLQQPVLLWPVAWAKGIPFHWLYDLSSILCLVLSAMLLIRGQNRWIRVIHFVSLFLCVAVMNSHGKIRHDAHLMLWISFLFLLLSFPKAHCSASLRTKVNNVRVFFAAQLFLLSTYTLSGFWKLQSLLQNFLNGNFDVFSAETASREIAFILSFNRSDSLLGDWLIEHSLFAMALWIGTLALQFFSLAIVFFPRFWWAWGIALFAFHVGTLLILNIHFEKQMFLPLIFLTLAPNPRNLICKHRSGQFP
jgi:hypothetical protein